MKKAYSKINLLYLYAFIDLLNNYMCNMYCMVVWRYIANLIYMTDCEGIPF